MAGARQEAVTHGTPSRRARLADYLGLERNVAISSAAVFLLGLGEELWRKFLPKYLEALGAGVVVVGLFGTAEDFFDAVYQYPGGWLADRAGRRRAFLVFIAVACVGYAAYLLSPSWPWAFVGLAFSMAWHSMASLAVFAVIGDALPKGKRAMGFTLQSILKRVPMVVSPLAGGTQDLGLDTMQLDQLMGQSGKVNGGVYQFSVPRAKKVTDAGMEVPPAMGLATAINLQPTGGGKAAITGDFVLMGSEVNPVIRALRENGIEVTALHSHMLTESPRLLFMHFWANDDAQKLARGLRAALDRTNVVKGQPK